MNPAPPAGKGSGGKLAGSVRALEPGRLVVAAELPGAAEGELVLRDQRSGAEVRKPLVPGCASNGESESVIELFQKRERLTGLKLTYEAPVLRHFTARLETLSAEPAEVAPRP